MWINSGVSFEGDDEDAAKAAAGTFKTLLTAAVQRRVDALSSSSCASREGEEETTTRTAPLPRIGVLFSGGIDCVLLAALLHLCLPDPLEPIDLINVTFFGDTDASGVMDTLPSPDRLASISALVELEALFPSRKWNLVHVDVPPHERLLAEPRIRQVIFPSDTHMDLNIGTAFWFASRAKGYTCTYTRDDAIAALSTEAAGRPLLRLGSEGAARGRGQKSVMSAAAEAAAAGDDTAETAADRYDCVEAECRKPAKKGCSNSRCGQCCLKLALAAATAAGSTLPLPAWQCAVHKHKRQHKDADRGISGRGGSGAEADEAAALLLRSKPTAAASVEYSSPCRVLIVGIGADEQMAGKCAVRCVTREGVRGV